MDAVVELRLGERRFELAFEEAHLHVKERDAIRPQLIVAGPLEAFQAWLFKGIAAADLQRAGKLAVDGDPAVWRAVQGASAPTTGRAPRSLAPPCPLPARRGEGGVRGLRLHQATGASPIFASAALISPNGLRPARNGGPAPSAFG